MAYIRRPGIRRKTNKPVITKSAPQEGTQKKIPADLAGGCEKCPWKSTINGENHG